MLYQSYQRIIDRLAKQVESLKGFPYRTMVLCGAPRCGKTTVAKELAKRCHLRYIDFLEEELLPLGAGIEAFDRHKLLAYMREAIMESQTGVIFDELEGLFATWGDSESAAFFRSLYRFKIEFPAIVVTRQSIDFRQLLGDPSRLYEIG